ncbi:uncharacterized protein F5891DRAFT_1182678 [Suillus fuscotomentosus]|uniref:Uncharacterized protein n=1 Tax=Suillus fuscotomentosus TaxID=1912939 RepID=A0AAD4EIH1_9AGAM|nr:uncharacterized protein F5891DRAFT_1182678 [Suillus fuscotomentosus]KAG1905614.1 hypothetical protein F5891DRAFT_1182678 [Suillus fuscotomentosus]
MSSVGQNFILCDCTSQQPPGCPPLPAQSVVQFSASLDNGSPCTQALFPPLQHGYAALPSSHSVDWEARVHHNCHNQFRAWLERRKLNDPYSKTACQECTHAHEQRMHDLSKDTARIKKAMERSKEEHEHWMSKEQKMADRAKQKELLRGWKEWWRNAKAWSSCQEQLDFYDKLLHQAPTLGWELPPGWKCPPPPSGKLF